MLLSLIIGVFIIIIIVIIIIIIIIISIIIIIINIIIIIIIILSLIFDVVFIFFCLFVFVFSFRSGGFASVPVVSVFRVSLIKAKQLQIAVLTAVFHLKDLDNLPISFQLQKEASISESSQTSGNGNCVIGIFVIVRVVSVIVLLLRVSDLSGEEHTNH